MIAATRSRGYAYSNQLYELDVCSVAVPFFDHMSFPMGTLAVATPAARMTNDTRQTFADSLTRASLSLSQSLGGKIPADLYENWTSG